MKVEHIKTWISCFLMKVGIYHTVIMVLKYIEYEDYNQNEVLLTCCQNLKYLNEMHEGYAVAVIRGKNKEDAVEISKAAFKGGIRSLEVTFSTPGAEDAIAELVELGETANDCWCRNCIR